MAVFDLQTATFLQRIKGHKNSVYEIELKDHMMLSCGRDKVQNTESLVDF